MSGIVQSLIEAARCMGVAQEAMDVPNAIFWKARVHECETQLDSYVERAVAMHSTDALVAIACPKCGSTSSDEAAARCIPDSCGDSCPGCEDPIAAAWDAHPAPSQAVATAGDGVTEGAPLAGHWHHGNGFICCGQFRIAREDWEAGVCAAPGMRTEVFDWMCRKLNASPSAPRVGVPEEWEDIATAPNDGTPHVRGLHVYSPDGKYLYWDAITGYVDSEDGVFFDMGGDVVGWDAVDFTHWHPLAAAPEVPK